MSSIISQIDSLAVFRKIATNSSQYFENVVYIIPFMLLVIVFRCLKIQTLKYKIILMKLFLPTLTQCFRIDSVNQFLRQRLVTLVHLNGNEISIEQK